MPTLACRICGRVVYTTASLDALLPEELRCPRCGAILGTERRAGNRRKAERRVNPRTAPGAPDGRERRSSESRQVNRRREDDKPLGSL